MSYYVSQTHDIPLWKYPLNALQLKHKVLQEKCFPTMKRFKKRKESNLLKDICAACVARCAAARAQHDAREVPSARPSAAGEETRPTFT